MKHLMKLDSETAMKCSNLEDLRFRKCMYMHCVAVKPRSHALVNPALVLAKLSL